MRDRPTHHQSQHQTHHRRALAGILTFLTLITIAPHANAAPAEPVRFEITIPDDLPAYTGRIYIALAEAEPPAAGRGRVSEPRRSMHSWFSPPPVFAIDVANAQPGDTVTIEQGCLAHPMPIEQLPEGRWLAQAILRLNPDSPKAGTGAGDRYSDPIPFTIKPANDNAEADNAAEDAGPTIVRLTPTNIVAPRAFEPTDRVRLLEFRSERLSEFHGRDVTVRAGIVVPEGFDERADERFPVVIDVPGFGGDHFSAFRIPQMLGWLELEDVLYVIPDPSCFRGHSVFADSANNGPWGDMLINEMIPRIDAEFRGAGPEHRYATGISSGGWSSLWLQTTYPEHFAGCWSHVPDPIDFRDFQRINLYEPDQNIYTDAEGEPRPLARANDRVILTYQDFVAREQVLGPGGQIHSFEAVFSQRGPDGTPEPLFDRATGNINTATAESWRPYDISHTLRSNWDQLAPKLNGRIHIYAGEVDTFYLEGAVALLKQWRDTVDADMVVQIVEGMAHSPSRDGMRDMAETIKRRWEASAAQ
ncbi:MAG: alpha/beta hydrolase-fold protein [Phycisphaerales bacterium]